MEEKLQLLFIVFLFLNEVNILAFQKNKYWIEKYTHKTKKKNNSNHVWINLGGGGLDHLSNLATATQEEFPVAFSFPLKTQQSEYYWKLAYYSV